ncbi:Uncharacterised protein [uncultured archaeon]|nr:Uncharacterised protein [uncultured archaeon]
MGRWPNLTVLQMKAILNSAGMLMSIASSGLILTVVLGMLAQQGTAMQSSVQSAMPNTCIIAAPYLCKSVSLDANGILTARIGQIGSAMSITATGCSGTSEAPGQSSFVQLGQPVQLVSGGIAQLKFTCPMAPNSSSLAGSLWIIYDTPGSSGLVAQVGAFNAKAQ